MKNNLIGFGFSALLHVTVVAQLWLPDSKPIVEPKEKIVPLNMAMFQEQVKKIEPIIKPPPKVIEKPIPKEVPVEKTPPAPLKVEKKVPVLKEVIPLPVPVKAPPKIIKKQPVQKKITKKKPIIKPKKKVIKKRPKKQPIKKKALARNRLEEDIEKLLNPKKSVVKKTIKPQLRKQPPVRRAIKRPAPVHQPRRQNQMVRKAPPRIHPPKANNSRKVTKRPPQRRQATPNTASLEAAYKSRLRQLIESKKKYPRRAKRRGDQGVVRVSFVMTARGQVSQIQVIQSSGSRILDEAAKKTVQKISGIMPFPKEIKKAQWKFMLPLTYRFRR